MFDKKRNFIAILDTMWGSAGAAPHWFHINPDNVSGRRLYKLTQTHYGNIVVVNSCREQVGHSRHHGAPDPRWLLRSLRDVPKAWRMGILLVCGKVAQKTFEEIAHEWSGPVYYMMHPASRSWTKANIKRTQREIDQMYRKRKRRTVGII